MTTRDQRGRFKQGNPGGPGRPRRQTEREYLRATVEACSLDDWSEVVQKAVADAKDGDTKARDWLSDRLLGRMPVSLVDLEAEAAAGVDPVADAVFMKQLASPFSGMK